MELCSDGHIEICYEVDKWGSRVCPVCELKQEIEELKNQIEEKEK